VGLLSGLTRKLHRLTEEVPAFLVSVSQSALTGVLLYWGIGMVLISHSTALAGNANGVDGAGFSDATREVLADASLAVRARGLQSKHCVQHGIGHRAVAVHPRDDAAV
jgi:hypothetical protein